MKQFKLYRYHQAMSFMRSHLYRESITVEVNSQKEFH